MDLGIAGRLALVTGASQGIGRAVALTLAREGARVVAVARNPDRLSALIGAIEREGGWARAVPADLSRPPERARLLAELERLGQVELFLGNTGGPPPGPAQALRSEELHNAAEQLLYPMVDLTRALLPGMQARRFGRILYITSLAVREPIENLALSNTLRAGLTGYAKTLAREVAAWGITVNTLGPGYTQTERLEAILAHRAAQRGVSLEAAHAEQTALIPMSRLASPQEIADVAVFLLSERASYLTGQALMVEGGALRSLL
ncbi:SDR family NAD(P)-dependent oxidoreductase [Meiothermus sp. QL-1]|uniref:SDR family oxidoreductase n=1 Tax=Meiothermus sp. QL-1 TaxID=2058095 RepID=UPI000E0B54D3|nr:SDR family oxidoreductase [Meiothermus sp. QL-1]RDI96116.1 SDR family NAD(P)-dependent oxidoreductase [Meiothermus sp. QL-1]